MQTSLAKHHAILRVAIEANGGQVIQIIGDAFQAAFRMATQRLEAALVAQRHLRTVEWGATRPIKVHMGKHTGHAELDPRENAPYQVSYTLNRAARVMASGHGGQILLSQEAANLVDRELPEGVSLRDLGKHRLKGMQWQEHLYHVLAPDLQQEFPPLKSSTEHPNNLPFYGFGKLSMIKGELGTAKTYFRKSLEESIKNGNLYQVKFCLEAFLFLYTSHNENAADAARTIGILESFSQYHGSWTWGDRNYYLAPYELDGVVDQTPHWLGESDYNRLLSEGQAMTTDQATALVLAD